MCQGAIGPFPVLPLTGRPATATGPASYACRNCGAPLFGLMNENCQYCATKAQEAAEVSILSWPTWGGLSPSIPPVIESGGGGDFGGGGATSSWDSGSDNTGNGE
jgi:hypothetical protein